MNIPKTVLRLLLGRRLPITTGTLKLAGISESVLIRRDGYGIAYVEAAEDADAWYGLGFCHGQDRAFQIEGLLRATRGTLAEVIGHEAVPIDRLSRRVGFYHSAVKQLEALDDNVRHIMEAYARGVTDGVSIGCHRVPHEFTLLRFRPTPYSAADILSVFKLMSFVVPSNWDVELARLNILNRDGADALTALDPTYPEWLPVTSPPAALAGKAAKRLAEDITIFMETCAQGGGSNAWAIAPTHTATGRAILAADLHLPPVLPPYWYLAHVRTPNWAVAGASFVGAPSFLAGHNGSIAWGETSGFVDNTDLFIEEIGIDGCSVREGDTFIPCETRTETIHVKGGRSIEENVLVTPRGPIISPALEGETQAISLGAIWLDPRPIEGVYCTHQATTFDEFRHAFAHWPGLPLNWVYADTAGTIGWQLVGEAPQRQRGWGTIPLPARDSECGWEPTTVPFDQMPYLVNPETGFVATANNQPTVDEDTPFLGADWKDGYRVTRITEALGNRRDWDAAGTQTLQLDQASIPWREMRDTILTVSANTTETQQALEILEKWDGRMAIDSYGATVFEFFMDEMVRRIAESKAPRSARWVLGEGFTPLLPRSMFGGRRIGHLARLMREQPTGWFKQPWASELADALSATITTLRERYGANPKQWTWGRVRPLTLRHWMGERVPLDRIFNLGPSAWGGDTNTVSQSSVSPADPTANPVVIASLRMVIDVGNWDESQFILPGGQSGNPLSPHYSDQFPLWQRGQGVPIAWSGEKIAKVCQSTLRLVPKQGTRT